MGRELQKKKNRSGIRKPGARKQKRPAKKTHKPILANTFLAENWDKKQTVTQNYARLGLARRLKGVTGGVERFSANNGAETHNAMDGQARDGLAIRPSGGASSSSNNNAANMMGVVTGEARIQRDESTGAILRVLDDAQPDSLHAPLNGADESSDEEAGSARAPNQHDPNKLAQALRKSRARSRNPAHPNTAAEAGASSTPVVRQLEREAAAQHAAPRKARTVSAREAEWLARLIERHGVDEDGGCFERMARDAELNIRQQSAGDLRRRVRRFVSSAPAAA